MILWGCFSSKAPGKLVRLHGIMNSLNLDLVDPARKLKLGHRWVFQPEKDPKHTSKTCVQITK